MQGAGLGTAWRLSNRARATRIATDPPAASALPFARLNGSSAAIPFSGYRRRNIFLQIGLSIVISFDVANIACAQIVDDSIAASTGELKKLSLEDLVNVEVTSVSRHPEKLAQAPAAIQVITGEQIRRSGASSIPEALRLAENLDVAQKNSHDWATTARGFNTALANKLLVLIDGRTVYTPLFSGVFWDVQNYPLADIERIEVISGPGGTQWGANAVNGVINIITKNAGDTQGGYLEAAAGNQVNGLAGGPGQVAIQRSVYGKIVWRF